MSKNSSDKIKIIAIVGATASGKTAYSIELAQKLDAEIISADSRLVYKGMDIGTAKPTTEEQCGIPHYLIDIVEPDFEYSAGLYKQQAQEIIQNIHNKRKTPIIVGGTGLYLDMLLRGYELPNIEADNELRGKLKDMQKEDLHKLLKEKDFNAAKEIDPNDTKKIIRAIELIEKTGKTLNEIRSKTESQYDVKWIGRNFERNKLYERINNRVDLMIEQGLVQETKDLINKYGKAPNIVNTIGYKEICSYLDNQCSLDTAIETLKQNTRRYAKRQLTWFRKYEDIEWNIFPETLKK